MTTQEELDPFSLTADKRLYVPRPATERALAALREALEEGGRAVALTGPPGLGKTLLLHVLAERMREHWRPLFLPYAALSPEDLGAWIEATGKDATPDPEEAEAQLLLIDDAGALPSETARWLGSLAAEGEGRIAVAVAASDRAVASARLAALGPAITVRLAEAMDDEECAAYVRQRLALAGAPPRTLRRFDPATLRRLFAISGGNPRRLHIAATDLLEGGSGQVPEDLFATANEPALAIPGNFVEED